VSVGPPRPPRVTGLDHLVLTVRDLAATIDFYERTLGMRAFSFAGGSRWALAFGSEKLNLHELGNEYLPNARHAQPGSATSATRTATSWRSPTASAERPLRV
jgi:catechol 2,3-dioxygenase-like lactoylglutathione lyase family enzyme